jgi:CspA family cold shock protein
MAQGTIKKLVSDRGFGFIQLDGAQESGKDLFFHRNDVQGLGYDTLREGDRVTYDEANDERRDRPKAANVTPASTS